MLLWPALADAAQLGLETGTGPSLRVRLYASDGFTEEIPIFDADASKIPLGGFANTTESGVLQPVLFMTGFGFVWSNLDYHGTIGVAQTQVTLHIDRLAVEYSSTNAPLHLGNNTVGLPGNPIQGELTGQLTVAADAFPLSIPLYGGGPTSTEMTNLNGVNFDRLRVFSNSNNDPVGLPFKTLIAQSGGVDFSLAIGADFTNSATFDSAATPIPESATAQLLACGFLGLAVTRHKLRRRRAGNNPF
jgi:hypothetical protein